MKFTAATVVALLGTVSARPAPVGHVRHEARDADLADVWVKRDRPHEGTYVPVRVGLTQSNLEKGAEMLMDISHPYSPNYGKHLSTQEIADLFAPDQHRIDSVGNWLKSALNDKPMTLSSTRQWFQFNATIAELQDLLHADYHEYEHTETGRTALGCDEYHVPGHVSEHLDFIHPGVATLELPKHRNLYKRSGGAIKPQIDLISSVPPPSAEPESCASAITATCIRSLYNITDQLKGNKDNSIGIFEEGFDIYNHNDLNSYFKKFAPEIPQGTSPVYDQVDGAPEMGSEPYPGLESNLDLQAAYPLVYPDKVINYQVDDVYYAGRTGFYYRGQFNTFLDALDKSYCNYSAFGITGDSKGIDPEYPDTHTGGWNKPEQCGVYKPDNVLSISYSDDEQDLPMNYQRRQCNEWMKLGLSGVSVIVSSGDSGVNPRNYIKCKRNNTLFETQSPINCPWVTAVGATSLPPGHVAGKDPEAGTTSFASSGGFSNIFAPASYQVDAINAYFKNSPPPYDFYNITLNATHTKGRYNRGGRGIPDVSATGQNFVNYYWNSMAVANGTSISAPVFASIITRINSFRLDAGKKPVGFVNPTLYQHPEVMNDITSGNNPGCGTQGFSAAKGWDPVTGLGTPNYPKMKELFMSLP